jgi:hypothetical protein
MGTGCREWPQVATIWGQSEGLQRVRRKRALFFMFARSDLPKIASNSPSTPTPEEAKALGSANASQPAPVDPGWAPRPQGRGQHVSWTATDQKRPIVSFAGDELKWTLAASMGGTGEVTLKRLK